MQTPPPSQRKFMTGPRRVASVPVRLAGSPMRPSTPWLSSSPSASTEYGSSGSSVQNNIDLLFAHSSARIVSFNSASGLGGQLLSWTSPTERTIASGSIRIYKTIPHDIAFLQSGSALRPVLSRSQCWNVDGRGIFCLQIRPGSFWRLEILEPEDGKAVKAIEFRDVLVNILAYEITVCPFLRTGESCVREAEVLGVLQPSKVWRRPSRTASMDFQAAKELPMVEEKKSVVEELEEDIEVFGLELTPKPRESEEDKSFVPIDILPEGEILPKDQTFPSSVDFAEWQGFVTPKSFGVSRSCAAPPQLTDENAFSTISTPSSCISTPCPSPTKVPTTWHTQSQPQPIAIVKRRDRSSSLTSVETESTAYTTPSQGSPTPSTASTPTLWSGSDYQSEDNWSELTTPSRAPAQRVFDPISTTTKPRLTRSASSIMLSSAAGIANVVVIRPSSYIASLMFSIAAKIATRAVTGAAYSLTERMYTTDLTITSLDDNEGFECEDDYGECIRPGKADGWEKMDPWGVE